MWHGTMQARTSRPVPGSLSSRQDGSWIEGIPFRGAYWLKKLGNHPSIGLSVATLATAPPTRPGMVISPSLLKTTLRPSAAAASAVAPVEGGAATQVYVPGDYGPHLVIPPGRTDAQLRSALGPYEHVSMVKVSLSDAASLLRCYTDGNEASEVKRLVGFSFKAEWCYRPVEMTDEWARVESRGRPRHGDEPWCVWGFSEVATPGTCSA